MRRLFLFFVVIIFLNNHLQAQYTHVPDPNFEQALIDLGIDSEGVLDGQFLTTDAIGITVLDVKEKNISDLTGLEAFVDLHDLWATNNNLTSVDLSMLPNATIWTVSLSNNNISSIDISPISRVVNLLLTGNNLQNVEVIDFSRLYVLGASNQDITSITLQNCPNLQVLEFANTSLTSINLSECPNLRSVQCQNSQLQSIDFTYNQNLEYLLAYNLPLTNINLPNNSYLEELNINSCQLTALDVSSCNALWYFNCSNNNLTSLDLSGNPILEDLRCSNNQLTTINLTQNPFLTNLNIKNNNLSTVDLSHTISLIDLNANDNPIAHIAGISNCINLESIGCENTSMIEFDLSQNINLEFVSFFQQSYIELVNIKNGNNANMLFIGTQCPQLSCVVVDEPNATNDNIHIDGNTTLVSAVAECEGINIEESGLQLQIVLYPNPVEDILTIESNDMVSIQTTVFYDLLGKKVYESAKQNIALSHLSSGIYLLHITTDSGVIVKKVVKE